MPQGTGTSESFDVVVVGQIARDLVLLVDAVPDAGTSATVRERVETLGGKGANQAVSAAQLDASVALVGVVGDDRDAAPLLDRARRDGIDVRGVIRRHGVRTGLIVNVVDGAGRWRYLEDLPPSTLLTDGDVLARRQLLSSARVLMVQLQQPAATALTAARIGRSSGALVVVDGVPDRGAMIDEVVGSADVVRADAREAGLLAGEPLRDVDAVVRAARALLAKGPRVVALAAGDEGNVIAWPDGEAVIPLRDTAVADTTGAGDAFTAALAVSLLRGADPAEAGRNASEAAASTVRHIGGRPRLSARGTAGP